MNLITKKVLEKAIKEREDKVKELELEMENDLEGLSHVFSEPVIKGINSHINQLKEDLQKLYTYAKR